MASFEPSPLRKRGREPASEEDTDDMESDVELSEVEINSFQDRSKAGCPRHRTKRTRSTNLTDLCSQYVILHLVECGRSKNHDRHQPNALYLDRPRLLAGDSKASALRGHQRLEDIEEYLEENPDISFIVYRKYSCEDYCSSLKNKFLRLPTPQIDRKAFASVSAYFFSLEHDGEDAVEKSEYIEVISKKLQHAMENLESRYPDHFREWTSSPLRAPYLQFYHCREILLNHSAEAIDQSQAEQIAALFKYVSLRHGREWKEADELFNAGQVSWSHFAKLYGPNEVVVTTLEDQPMAYICKAAQSDGSTMELDCWSWDYDGTFYKKSAQLSSTWPYDRDQILINSLRVYPLKYNGSGLENRLRKRGEQFWTCRYRRFVGYSAPKLKFESRTSNPRYMIDTNMFHQMHNSESTQRDDLDKAAMKEETPPEGPFCLLLPYTIRGFGIHDKKWIHLNIEKIRPIEWNEKAFERRLVLDPTKKELIQALITVHIDKSNTTTTDIIEGKGKGLIILLHGSPGTGKSLTAESVAELAQKPLYRVTCGDIGTDPEGVEKYLESVLYIGALWECVVLLDEADVFLEERSQTDLQRNALVSVFLRVLEYYEGILILTTNRVGMFDEAFMSRIQLALHYPPLDEEGRFEIWDNFLQTLKDEVENVNHGELKQKRNILARHKLNGRQIRNTVNTARQLAYFKGDRLGYSHFHQAIEVAKEFEKYLDKTHGHTNEEWAKAQGLR